MKTLDGIVLAAIIVLVGIIVFQFFLVSSLMSGIGTGSVTGATTNSDVNALIAEIMPSGTPDYGNEAGVSYDSVEQSLQTLIGYQQSISLTGSDQDRFIEIATTPDTACEYCCGIGNAGFGTSDGSIACGCGHNIAFGGLTKWLIKNTDYTNEQIIQEISKWKILFFPGPAVASELQARGIDPATAGLASQVGGC